MLYHLKFPLYLTKREITFDVATFGGSLFNFGGDRYFRNLQTPVKFSCYFWRVAIVIFTGGGTFGTLPYIFFFRKLPYKVAVKTVLRAVSGNSRDKQAWRAKKAMVHRRKFFKIYSFKFCDIWQNFYFYRILNNENFKMEVEQTNFVTRLIITVQSYY